jgi:hypothetical protein
MGKEKDSAKPKRGRGGITVNGRIPIPIDSIEHGYMDLYFADVRGISHKNFGSPRRPVTKITLVKLDKEGKNEELHILEGPRKFIRRAHDLAALPSPGSNRYFPRGNLGGSLDDMLLL